MVKDPIEIAVCAIAMAAFVFGGIAATSALQASPKQAVLGVFVTDEAGKPLVKATVYFAEQPYINLAAVTGRDGLAYFGQYRTGDYRLCAMANGYAEHCADVEHVDARAKTIVLTRVGR